MGNNNQEEVSMIRALRLWDMGKIEEIDIGNFKGLQEIHYYLFNDIKGYNAGEIRTVNISKGGFLFASSLYLPQALKEIDGLPDQTFDEIINKYIEMNIAHPFIEGNGRSTRIWLDLLLRTRLGKCVDWSAVDKLDYLTCMKLSPTQPKYIKALLSEALTEVIHSRQVYMKGIEQSYLYEGYGGRGFDDLI